MSSLLLSLGALILSFGVLLAGSSLQFVLLGLRAPLEGIGVGWMGIVSASYFAGFGVGTLYCPRMVQDIGHVRTFAALASVASGLALLLALWPTGIGWVVVRFVTGICFAGLYTVVESWMNARAPNELRGRILSIYSVSVFGGFAVGPLLATLDSPQGLELFALASILISFALVPVTVTRAGTPVHNGDDPAPRRYGLARLLRETPLGAVGSFAVGVLQGSFNAMLSVYGASAGFDAKHTSWLLTAGLLAGLVAQYPLGWLSDRLDRRTVLAGITLIGGGAMLALYAALLASMPTYAAVLVTCIVTGITIFPPYALVIAHTNDWLPESSLVPAAATLLLLCSLGGIAGNLAASATMGLFGPNTFFLFLAAVNLAFGAFVVERMRRRAAPEGESVAYDFAPAAPGTLPLGGAYESTTQEVQAPQEARQS